MLATGNYEYYDTTMPNHELLEVHRTKISLHHAKTGYNYPAIRLPFTFSKLAGLSTCIYQTVHDGALAFLVVISSKSSSDKHKNALSSAKSSVLTWRRSPVRIRPSPLVLVLWGAQLFVGKRIAQIMCHHVSRPSFSSGVGCSSFSLLNFA